jgi:dipeptidyl aminopeptidase/acylaminoacyl peptidase
MSRSQPRARERVMWTLTAASLIVVVAVIAIGIVRILSAEPSYQEPRAVSDPSPSTAAEEPSRRTVFLDLGTGAVTDVPDGFTRIADPAEFAVSPDGTMVTFTGLDGVSNPRDVFVANIDGTDVRPITDGPLSTSTPDWSPDGRTIAYTVEVKAGAEEFAGIYSVGVHGGKAIQLSHDARSEFWRVGSAAAFSPDGRTLLFTRSDGHGRFSLWTMPSTGGSSRLLLQDAAYGAYSPDGSTIAYQRTGQGGAGGMWPEHLGVWLADADGSDPVPLSTDAFTVAPLAWKHAGPTWSPDGSQIAFSPGGDGAVQVLDVTSREVARLDARGWASWRDDDSIIVEGFGLPVPAFTLSDLSGIWLHPLGADPQLLTITPYGRYSLARSGSLGTRPDEIGTVEIVGSTLEFRGEGGASPCVGDAWTLERVSLESPTRVTGEGAIGACGSADDQSEAPLVLVAERPPVHAAKPSHPRLPVTTSDLVGTWSLDGQDGFIEYGSSGSYSTFSNSLGDPELSDGKAIFEGGVEGSWTLDESRLRIHYEFRAACTGPDGSGYAQPVDDPRSEWLVAELALIRPDVMVMTTVKDWCWGSVGERSVQIRLDPPPSSARSAWLAGEQP